MNATPHKSKLLEELIASFRDSGNLDRAIDNLAAERLGVNDTDLHCLNAIENSGGLTAGQLASAVGVTTGAITGVVDRLELVGYAHRVQDPSDRRRVRIEVTPNFYRRADAIWGPMKADWEVTLSDRFTAAEIELIIEFLRLSSEIGQRHLRRLAAGASTAPGS
jgi:DNA-binding MarR family transcriptional regulator